MFKPSYAKITASLTKMVTELGALVEQNTVEQAAIQAKMQALGKQNADLEQEKYTAAQTKRRLEELLGGSATD